MTLAGEYLRRNLKWQKGFFFIWYCYSTSLALKTMTNNVIWPADEGTFSIIRLIRRCYFTFILFWNWRFFIIYKKDFTHDDVCVYQSKVDYGYSTDCTQLTPWKCSNEPNCLHQYEAKHSHILWENRDIWSYLRPYTAMFCHNRLPLFCYDFPRHNATVSAGNV